MYKTLRLFLSFFSLMLSCNRGGNTVVDTPDLDTIARSYAKLVFQVGKHDSDYVDAYFGPDTLKKEAESEELSLAQIGQKADSLIASLTKFPVQNLDEDNTFRRKNLLQMLCALKARVNFLGGVKMSFDEESKAIYGAVSPHYGQEHFDKILRELDTVLPGQGDLSKRFEEYRQQFVVPAEKLDVVFQTAINQARDRTKKFITLPENESFVIAYVQNKSWSAYNWFKGNGHSLIQVNTDLPIYVDRVLDLACHEGYPGHHVYHSLMEKNFYRGRNWVEFSIYPLFSPQALLSEGSANFGIQVAFPNEERIKFEREVIFPLAGINSEHVSLYYQILEMLDKLSYAGNEAARLYLDGKFSREETIVWLIKYRLQSRARSERYMKFIEQYRAYVITYNVGEDMVKDYMERATKGNVQKRWEEFAKLITTQIFPE